MFVILTSGLLAVSLASGNGVGAGFAVGTAAGAALTEGVEDAPVFVPALGEALGVALAEGLGDALAEGLVVTVAKGVNVCKGISDGSDVIFVSGEGESTVLSGTLVEAAVDLGVAVSPFTDIFIEAVLFEPSVVFAVIVTLPAFFAFTVPFLVTVAVAGLELL